VYGLNTSHQAWIALATKFASMSKSQISHLKKQLRNLSQGTKTYSDTMKTLMKVLFKVIKGYKTASIYTQLNLIQKSSSIINYIFLARSNCLADGELSPSIYRLMPRAPRASN
jgi:hypothetical protein